MSTLYKPVLVESAEQAEALDGKAILVFAQTSTGEVLSSTLREDVIIRPTFPDYPGETVTALVPIEAEEETTRLLHLDGRMDGYMFEPGDELPEWCFNGPPRTRYVTGWTEKA